MMVQRCAMGIIVAACIQCLIGQIIENEACDPGWRPYNKACYKIDTTKKINAIDADLECKTQGAKLVSIRSTAEIEWIVATINTTGRASDGVWTSLNDIPLHPNRSGLGSGNWQWGRTQYADMSLIDWNQSPVNDGVSNCAGLNIQGNLSDIDCNTKQGFICKFVKKYHTDDCPWQGFAKINDICYWVSNISEPALLKTWDEAKQFCETQLGQGTFFVMTNPEEINFMKQYLPSVGKFNIIYWTGLTYTNNQWGWYNGGDVSRLNIFVKWQGEPDNVGGKENCVTLRMNGMFSDVYCGSLHHNLCVKPQYNTAIDANDNNGCGHWTRVGKMCVGVGLKPKTWDEARGYCKRYLGDLIKLDSLDKMEWLRTQMYHEKLTGVYWTGLNDKNQEGTYVWADGSPADNDLLNWNREPNNYMGQENCAMITSLGQYNDMSCFEHAAAICELRYKSFPITCQSGWTYFDPTNSCYFFTPHAVTDIFYTRQEAMEYCAQFGNHDNVAELISVESQSENTFLKEELKKRSSTMENPRGWWTSLNDVSTEGFWKFNTGPVRNMSLIEWSGEPSTRPKDDCGFVNFGAVFHQRECDLIIPFLCEKLATGVNATDTDGGNNTPAANTDTSSANILRSGVIATISMLFMTVFS